MGRREPRPTGVTLIALYEFSTAAVCLLATCVVLVFLTPAMLFTASRPSEAVGGLFFVLLLFGFFLAFAIGSALVGWGLLLQERWSRIGAMVLAIPALLGFPVWTVAAIAVLVYLASGEGRAAFEQVSAPEERAPVTSLAPPAPPPPPPGMGRSGSRAGDEHGGADSPAEETREVQPADRERPASGPPDD
ncbi:hypothetical protein [Sphaerobacter thermophilus]|uniref:DUF4064 domain-containing protein n=1 Tax=Sphaerobacter thermophilus (strain ATCC 49802 / DSM 20745 / KCCM 41009 / NCIMB 13125 / S 6022) TaxID=479434 RepID=D1C762_SPHTD|nr:hypothetical protein [Sphaerobacter thermophilus]ACZ39708.1 hypothetical protein Sthe_2287 [Sphaerobacter thermophilus DSM 20745]